MRTVYFKTVFFLSSALCAAAPQFALAQGAVDVRISSRADLTSAIGVLMAKDGAREISGVRVSRETESSYIVSVPLLASEAVPGNFVSAVATSEAGMHYANVRPAFAADHPEASLQLPPCPEEPAPERLQSEMSNIGNLVKVRAKQRDNYRARVENKLSGRFQQQLQSFEKNFGLTHDQPLSVELPPYELLERLSRLRLVINNYTHHHAKRKAKAAAAAEAQ